MRRPALLAFGLFTLAASLPAEVRECLPMQSACARRPACERPAAACDGARTSCARPAAKVRSCPMSERAASTRTGCLPDLGNCRLHPAPPGTATPQALSLDAPAPALLPVDPIADLDEARASHAGWTEPQVPKPRAAPRASPLSPRPPPLAV